MDIVVTGYAGFEGSKAIYDDKVLGRKLKERYSESFFGVFRGACTDAGIKDIVRRISDNADASLTSIRHGMLLDNETVPEDDEIRSADYKNDGIHVLDDSTGTVGISQLDRLYAAYQEKGLAADGSSGGVLAALWRVLKNNHKGGMYALGKIPILQQTVEVCEMYSLNPYRLYAPKCRVWLSTDTGALAQAAADAGVPLSVIGFTSKGVAIKRTDTDADSSLRRPEADELHKVLLY